MALIYSTGIRNLFVGRALFAGFSPSAPSSTTQTAITVYSGAQPTAANIISSWATYNTSFLAHYNNAVWTHPSNGILLQLTTNPGAVLANATGTATWAILWASNPANGTAAGQIGNATIPSNSFVVVPASISTGQGVIRFSDPAFTAGVSKAITDGSIGAFITP